MSTRWMQLVALLTVFTAGLVARAHAADGTWFDTRFQKSWVLSESDKEVLILFEPAASALDREILADQWDLLPSKTFDPVNRAQVFRTTPHTPGGVSTLSERHTPPGVVHAVVPAMVDQEGYTKYYLPDQATVQFKSRLTPEACLEKIHAAGASVIEDHWTPGYYTIALPPGQGVFAAVRSWYADPDVLFSEPSYLMFDDATSVPNDPMFVQQWHLRNTGQGGGTPGADIDATLAWDITRGDPNVLVCVIDTGMDLTHEDLSANLLPRNGADWDFASADGSPDDEAPPVSQGHGTACAGIAVAVQNNLIGVSGVAPTCRVMPLRVDLGGGLNQNRADAINYGASRRKEFYGLVMSCSWRMSSGDFTAVRNSIRNADSLDCVMVFSSGNENNDVNYPAKYPETIACGATNWCDQRQQPGSCVNDNYGSDFGPELDVMAPGEKVVTTDMTGTAGFTSGNYNTGFSGTSAAAPVAAGVCALIWSVNPYLSAHQVRDILEQSAEDQVGHPGEDTAGWDQYYGWGRVNANLAVLAAIETIFTSDFEDDLEGGAETWVHSAQTGGYQDAWHLSQQRNHTATGSSSFKCGAVEDSTDHGTMIHAALRSPAIQLGNGTLLEFWHWMDAHQENDSTAGDGGILEISSNGGITWSRLDPAFGAYTHVWRQATVVPFSLNTPLWSGAHDWARVTVPLDSHAGQTVSFRYRYGTRGAQPTGEGWYVDDVTVYIPGSTLDDDLETGGEIWGHMQAPTGGIDSWHLSGQRNHTAGGTTAFKCGSTADTLGYAGAVDAILESPLLQLDDDLFLSFWHWMDAYTATDSTGTVVDGGVLEITNDYGNTWTRVTPVLGGYTHAIPDSTGSPLEPGTPVWSGSFDWRHVVADLSSYEGQRVRFRLRFAGRGAEPTGEGWYVDDLELFTPSEQYAENVETGAPDWAHAAVGDSTSDGWHVSLQRNHTDGGGSSFKCGSTVDTLAYANDVHSVIESPDIYFGSRPSIGFWHWMDAYAYADTDTALVDGGFLEISTDEGATWERVIPNEGAYTHLIPDSTGSPLAPGSPVWSGAFDWTHVTAFLNGYENRYARLRFHFAARGSDPTGEGWYVDDVSVTPVGSASAEEIVHPFSDLVMLPAAPNPFESVTSLRYRLGRALPVRIDIFDVSGRRIRTWENGTQTAGEHALAWDGTDSQGRPVAAGIYFSRIMAGRLIQKDRIALLR